MGNFGQLYNLRFFSHLDLTNMFRLIIILLRDQPATLTDL